MVWLENILKERKWTVAVIFSTCLCAVVILLPIYLQGMPFGGDQPQHLRFALALNEQMTNGQYSFNWTNENFGFGSVGGRVYPPLAHLFLVIPNLLGLNWFDSLAINLFGWLLVGCLGTYLVTSELTDSTYGLIGCLIFAIAPHHYLLVFQYFFYAEFVGLSILPWIFYALTRVVYLETYFPVLLLAASFSLLVLTHIPFAIIAVPLLAIYVGCIVNRYDFFRVAGRIFVASILSVFLTSFYWIGVVNESAWIQHNKPDFSTGYFGYEYWLVPNSSYDPAFYARTLEIPLYHVEVFLTVLLLLPGILCLFICRFRRSDRTYRILLGVITASAVGLFMLTQLSAVVWENIVFLQRLQFPFRWLSPVSFLVSIAFAVGMFTLVKEGSKVCRLFSATAIGVVIAVFCFNLNSYLLPPLSKQRVAFEEFVASVNKIQGPEWWWPIWAKPLALENKERITAGLRQSHIQNWETEDRTFQLGPGAATDVRVAAFYYPYWKATVNGKSVEVRTDENGAMLIPVPAEGSDIHLYFEEPQIYQLAEWTSLFSWCLLLGVLVAPSIASRKQLESYEFAR